MINNGDFVKFKNPFNNGSKWGPDTRIGYVVDTKRYPDLVGVYIVTPIAGGAWNETGSNRMHPERVDPTVYYWHRGSVEPWQMHEFWRLEVIVHLERLGMIQS
jgi:hypothetical protein